MATNLGTLTLNLLANTGSYIQGLSRAERETSQSTGKMKNAFSNFKSTMNESLNTSQLGLMVNDLTARLGGLSGGLLNVTAAAAGMAAGGSIVAAAGLTTLAIQTAKADAEMAVLANRAQIGTTNFQILTYASEQLGISQDQLGGIFADVQEKLGEFSATGSGGASDFFDALRNNTKLTDDQIKQFGKTLQGKDGVEAVQLLKNKLDELNASSQEQRFVFESLGSDLGNLLPLFENGGVLLEQYGQALEDAGVIKSKEAILQSQILAAQTQAVNLQFQGAKSELVQGFMPALVNVADAMFGTSKNGNQLQDVGEGLGTIFKSLASIGIGLSAVVQSVGDGFGALAAMAVAAASGDIKGAVAIYKDSEDQFAKIIEDSSERLDKLWAKNNDGKNSTSELTNAILALNQAQASSSLGLKVNTKEADENAKVKDKLANASARAARETSRLAEQQYKDRESIYYKYASREMKIAKDLQNEILKIQNANFSPKDTAGYIQNAQMRSSIEIQLYQAQLDAELNDWNSTEQEKLNRKVYINELMIQLDADMNNEQKNQAMQSLIERSNQELAWIKLEKAQRISDASEMLRTDLENIAVRYEFERKRILLNKSIADDERRALLNASVYSQNKDESQVRDSAISDYRNVMGFEESPLVRQFEVLQKMRELDLINEEVYQKSKLDLTLKYGASYMESMLGGFASLVDENSKTYAVLFAAQKAFAVAQAMLNIPQAYSKAYDAVVGTPYIGPYIAPAVGAAAAALQVAQATKIESVNYSGFATGGHITGKGTGTSDDIPIWASNGEFMIRAAAVEKLGLANLDYINRTGMLPPRLATGGMINSDIMKTKTISNTPSKGVDYNVMQSQQQQPTVDNNMKVLIFDDRASYEQEMMGPTGERIFMYHWKRNKSKLSG